MNLIWPASPPERDWLSPTGQRLGEVFFRRPGEEFQERGPRHYFDEYDKSEVQYKLEWRIPVKTTKVYPPPAKDAEDPVTSFGYIAKIIDFCRIHNIELKIFISPSHAHQLELTQNIGEWKNTEKNKKKIG